MRRAQALERGETRPGRVTEIIPDGKGGYTRRELSAEAWRRAARAHAHEIPSSGAAIPPGGVADGAGARKPRERTYPKGDDARKGADRA